MGNCTTYCNSTIDLVPIARREGGEARAVRGEGRPGELRGRSGGEGGGEADGSKEAAVKMAAGAAAAQAGWRGRASRGAR